MVKYDDLDDDGDEEYAFTGRTFIWREAPLLAASQICKQQEPLCDIFVIIIIIFVITILMMIVNIAYVGFVPNFYVVNETKSSI